MAGLSLRHISKVYDNKVKAVDDFSMEIEDKEFIVFVGPSGCGKSTTLRMIAGLEEITDGELYIDGRKVNDVEPKDRDIAMVFQNYALYPHMTVYQNIAFPLRMNKVPKDEIRRRVMEVAKILDIEEYLERKPKALSGGQRQRVALGRAIIRKPKVYLLDEPLSNLDAKLRAAMRTEISKLHEALQITFIYVTHDQVEAMTMGTRIVVMKDGVVQQIDTPQNLYDHPVNKFVGSFIGTPQMNFFNGTLHENGDLVFANNQKINLGESRMKTLESINGSREVFLGIRPEDIHLAGENETNVVKARIEIVEALGSEKLVYSELDLVKKTDKVVDENGNNTTVTVKLGARDPATRGEVVNFTFDVDHLHVFDKTTERTLSK